MQRIGSGRVTPGTEPLEETNANSRRSGAKAARLLRAFIALRLIIFPEGPEFFEDRVELALQRLDASFLQGIRHRNGPLGIRLLDGAEIEAWPGRA